MWWWKNKLFYFFLGSALLFTSLSSAQRMIDEGNRPPLKDRIYYGGNFGMSFGTITFIDVSPLVGAMVTNRLSGGVGGTYQYFNDRRFIGGNSSLYGGRLFSRYNVFPNVFAHAEYENLNFDLYNPRSDRFERAWVPGLLIGGGYFTPFGERGGANFTFLYNFLYDVRRSPYNEPFVIRFGFVL
ncbi:hypothetical protein [Cecembia sp.]|uniref:hypothetical protein n=1 Tax=Cecembia sp. TaxID=1898110 RepID=UPI0025BCCB38|nr:hypothetical protein [Cecembia sp.]